jgi:PAS domain S-box-containing protein
MLQVAGYEVGELLYKGTHSVIYRARSSVANKDVVLKAAASDYPSAKDLARLRREFEIGHRYQHRSIIGYRTIETLDTGSVLVLEDFGAQSLVSLLPADGLSVDEFLPVALQIAEGLREIHTQDVVHRNINPSNVLYEPTSGRVAICDFSIATTMRQEASAPIVLDTNGGDLAYVSPEQTGRTNRLVDYRTDLYSLGVTFYELLTGKKPFSSNDPLELVHAHIATEAIPVGLLEPSVPEVLSRIVGKLMAKDVEDRYQSAGGVLDDLDRVKREWLDKGTVESFQLGQQDFSQHFLIPQRLYGREKEATELGGVFDKVREGNCAFFLVTGSAGVGKTAVVNELQRSVSQYGGHFISGKFDQLGRNVAYSAFTQAFRQLVTQILGESETRLEKWRARINAALGSNGHLIVDLVPEMELVIGQQPPLPEVGIGEAQNRFNLVLQRFIAALACRDHPLVLFTDDLQWADAASLNLIKLLVGNPEFNHVLLIGAYRGEEVGPRHPTALAIEEIEASGVTISRINLQPLDDWQVTHWMTEIFNRSADEIRPLAELLLQKTDGNPFFIKAFLQSLYEEHLIVTGPRRGSWQWALTKIGQVQATENVGALMASKLDRYSADTRKLLQRAAALGSTFSLIDLAQVSQTTISQVTRLLKEPVNAGLLVKRSDNCSFGHDRVQEAAYAMISESERAAIHLNVGRSLLSQLSHKQTDESLMLVVHQLNLGTSLLVASEERLQVAELNLKAGKNAMHAVAFDQALVFFQHGCKLLGDAGWQTEYPLTITLHLGAAEAAYLNSEFGLSDRLADIVIANARSLEDHVKGQIVKLECLWAQNKRFETITHGLTILKGFGVRLSSKPSRIEISKAKLLTEIVLRGRKPESFVSLPKMTDSKKQLVMEIVSTLLSAAYTVAPDLFIPLVLLHVRLSVRFGVTPASPFGFACYGLLCSGLFGRLAKGYAFGQLALDLLNNTENVAFWTKTVLVVTNFVSPNSVHLRETLAPLLEGSRFGYESGDIEFASYCSMAYIYNSYFMGKNLEDFEQETLPLHKQIQDNKLEVTAAYTALCHQVAANLMVEHDQPWVFTGAHFHEENGLRRAKELNDQHLFANFHLHKLMMKFLFGHPRAAQEHAAAFEQSKIAVAGMTVIPVFYCYDSLTRLAAYAECSPEEQRTIRSRVRSNQKRLRRWARHAPDNYLHKYLLVEAERARIRGQENQAAALYQQAIAQARENDFLQEVALGYELLAQHELAMGRHKSSMEQMSASLRFYRQWGAFAKVHQLESRFPDLTSGTDKMTRRQGSASRIVDIDLHSVTLMSQAISSEMDLDSLLNRIMRLIIENAGAQKGVLVLAEGELLSVEVVATAESDGIRVERASDNGPAVFPAAVVRYVVRGGEPIIFGDASRDVTFQDDMYLHTVKPRSVLCMPLRRKEKTVGCLYLENNLTTNAFTEERVATLGILLNQSAISLENARLYGETAMLNRNLQMEVEVRQAAEVAAQEERETFFLVLENVPHGILVGGRFDGSGQISYVNPAFTEITGYKRDDIATVELWRDAAFFDRQGWRRFAKTYEKAMTRKEPQPESIHEVRCKDGGQKEISLQIAPLGKERFIAVLADVTEKRRQEAQTQHTQKLESLGVLAGGIAHDFSNLLVGIIGNADLADGLLSEPLRAHERINDIITAGHRASDLCRQLLAYAGKGQFVVAPTDMEQIVRDISQLLSVSISKKTSLDFQFAKDLPAINADVNQLRQLIMNLITNASESFGEKPGVITITTGLTQTGKADLEVAFASQDAIAGQYVYVEVSDTGCGMDEDTQKKIFDPFFTTKFTGRGLGMAAVLGIVHSHKGFIQLKSAVGKGTTISVHFPITLEKPALAPSVSRQKEEWKGEGTVLFVDDEEMVREVGREMFEKLGYSVVLAADGRKGLDFFEKHAADLKYVVLDLTMPQMDGVEVLSEIRSVRDDLPVILISGYDQQEIGNMVSNYNNISFLQKPFRYDDLVTALAKHHNS